MSSATQQLQYLRETALAQKRQVEAQQLQLQQNLESTRESSRQIETQKQTILVPLKRPTPKSPQAHPAYTRAKRESERVFLTEQYPQAAKQITEQFNLLNKSDSEIKSYLREIDDYLSQLRKEEERIAKEERRQEQYATQVFKQTGKSVRQFETEQYAKKLAKDYPEFNFSVKDFQITYTPKTDLTSTEKKDLVTNIKLDLNKLDKKIKLPYELKSTEIKTPPINYGSYIPLPSDTKESAVVGLPQQIPITSLLYQPSFAQKNFEKPLALIQEAFAKEKTPTKRELDILGADYKRIFDNNLKLQLQTQTRIENLYNNTKREVDVIASLPYYSKSEVDKANLKIKELINNFDSQQKSLVSSANTESKNFVNTVIQERNAKSPFETKVSNFLKQHVPDGLTFKEAEAELLKKYDKLKAQGFSDDEIRKKLGGSSTFWLKTKITLSQPLIQIRENPIQLGKEVAIATGVGIGVGALTTAVPVLSPYLIGAGLTVMSPKILSGSARFLAGSPETRGSMATHLTAQLVGGIAGAKLGGAVASKFIKKPTLEFSKIRSISDLKTNQRLEIDKYLSSEEQSLFEKARATGGRLYTINVVNPLTKERLNYFFIEIARFRQSTLFQPAGDRVIYGFAFNKSGKIVQRIFSVLLEGQNAKTEITRFFGDSAVFTLKSGSIIRRTLSGNNFRIDVFRGGEQVGKPFSISLDKMLVPTKQTFAVRGKGFSLKYPSLQKGKASLERGISFILRRQTFKSVSQSDAEQLWESLVKNYSGELRSRIPFGSKVTKITMIPRGREIFTELEFSIVKTLAKSYGKTLQNFRITFRMPTDIFLSKVLNVSNNTLIKSFGKQIKTFEIGGILSPSEFQKMFILFSRIKTYSMKNLNPKEVLTLKSLINKLSIKFNEINIRKLINFFNKREIIVHEGNVLDNLGQLESIYAGRGTYELSTTTLSNFLTQQTKPMLGSMEVITRAAAEIPFRTRVSPAVGISGLLFNNRFRTETKTKMNVREEVKVLQRVLQRNQLTQTDINQLTELNLINQQQLPQLTLQTIQQIAQLQLQKIQMQQIRTPTPPSPPRVPTSFLFSPYPPRREQRLKRKKKKEKRAKFNFRREPTVTGISFNIPRRRLPLTAFLVGTEIQR